MKTAIEQLLYRKAASMLAEVRKQQAAMLLGEMEDLHEADPKPKVEKNHVGDPVIPTEEQYREYFAAMQAAHVQDQLHAARERWKEATEKASEGSEFEKAELTALEREIEAATEVLGDSDQSDK